MTYVKQNYEKLRNNSNLLLEKLSKINLEAIDRPKLVMLIREQLGVDLLVCMFIANAVKAAYVDGLKHGKIRAELKQ